MTSPPVALERRGDAVGVIRIDRHEARNALSTEVRTLIGRHIAELVDDVSIRCIVLLGGEKVFASGSDIKELSRFGTIEKLEYDVLKRKLSNVITACPKPLIAGVRGLALGGGCELAMMCDIIVAGHSAKFGQPEVKLAIIPGSGGTQRLLRAVGKYRAMRYVLTGDSFTAHEAFDMGLVSDLVPDHEVESRALELAAKIAELSPLAVQQAKELLLRGADAPLELGLTLETKANQILFASRDQKEGMAAFIEKRKATFEGR